MPHRLLAACVAALPLWGCAGNGDTPIDTDSKDAGGPDAGSPLAALVFEVDPVTTPGPVLVELGWLDAEGDGTLTAALRDASVAAIVEPGEGDEGDLATWLLAEPAPGEHFLQFVAYGATESLLEGIAVSAD